MSSDQRFNMIERSIPIFRKHDPVRITISDFQECDGFFAWEVIDDLGFGWLVPKHPMFTKIIKY